MWFSILRSNPREDAPSVLDRYIERSQKPLSLISFSAIYLYKLHSFGYFSDSSIQDVIKAAATQMRNRDIEPIKSFLSAHGMETLLAIVTYLWWSQFSTTVKNEKKLLVELYNQMNVKKTIGSITGYKLIPYIGMGATLTFLLLAFLIDNIPLYCVVIFVLNMIDIWGNSTIRLTLTKDFLKRRFVPPESDPHRPFIIRRAEVLEEYWITNPQLERIGLVMICTSTALILYFSQQVVGFYTPLFFPYALIISCILVNEYTMLLWRKRRDEALSAIDIDEDKEFRKQIDGDEN